MVFQTEKSLKDLGDKVDDKEKEEAEELIKELKEALEKNDIDDIKEKKEKLTEKAMALATKVYEQVGKDQAANNASNDESTSTDNDDVKAIKSAAYSARVLGDAERYYTFPIVVFDTVNDDAKTFVTDEATGNISYKIMWYSISERGWEKKWAKALENMEDEPTHPGGLFLTLDYTYTPKRGEPNARDSARELQVYSKKIKNSEKLREVLDKQTESWTPEVARDMVIRNNLYAYADLEAVTEECLENTRNLIALYEAKGEAEVEGIEAASEFNLEKKTTPASETAVAMDDTDEDFDAEGLEVQ